MRYNVQPAFVQVGKMNNVIFSLKFAALLLLFSGCVTDPKVADKPVCAQTDWYELGRLDGAQGSPVDRFRAHQKGCPKDFRTDWETMYTNGRNAGLVEFCDPRNGYELGRSGQSYFYVCPSTVEKPFLASYQKGQLARELEIKNQKLDEEIDQLNARLEQTSSTNEQEELNSQLDELKKARAQAEQELNKITK